MCIYGIMQRATCMNKPVTLLIYMKLWIFTKAYVCIYIYIYIYIKLEHNGMVLDQHN